MRKEEHEEEWEGQRVGKSCPPFRLEGRGGEEQEEEEEEDGGGEGGLHLSLPGAWG